MGLKAQDWNQALENVAGQQNIDRIRNEPPADTGLILIKYDIIPDYEENHDGDEQPAIERYQPIWLYYPPVELSETDFSIQNDNHLMRVYGSDAITGFGTLTGDIQEWLVIGVSRERIEPGGIGWCVIEGRTVARCYDQRLTDSDIHQHTKLNYWAFMDDEVDYFPSDPPTVGLVDGKFTPYLAVSGASTPIRARLIWRNITMETTLDSDDYDPDSYDYGIVILPVFYKNRTT